MKQTPFKISLAAALLFVSCAATSTQAPVELPEPSGPHPFGPRPEVPQLWRNGELVEKHGESEEYRSEDPLEAVGTVLFVGNSFTFWNGGLWTHMQELTAAREQIFDDFKAKYLKQRMEGGSTNGKGMWFDKAGKPIV